MARQTASLSPGKVDDPVEPRWMLGLGWALGLLMVWAAISKLANPTQFLGSVYAYQLPFPRVLLKLVPIILPWLELLCGLALIARVWTESALLVTGGLLGIFVVATGQAWARGLKISCGCFDLKLFGIAGEPSAFVQFIESPAFAFGRNLVLVSGCFLLLRHRMTFAAASAARGESPGRQRAG